VVRERGTGDRAGVDAGVVVEAAVLGREDGVDQVAGDLQQRDGFAVLAAQDGQLLTVGVVDHRLDGGGAGGDLQVLRGRELQGDDVRTGGQAEREQGGDRHPPSVPAPTGHPPLPVWHDRLARRSGTRSGAPV
jgi:hypothetical protein